MTNYIPTRACVSYTLTLRYISTIKIPSRRKELNISTFYRYMYRRKLSCYEEAFLSL